MIAVANLENLHYGGDFGFVGLDGFQWVGSADGTLYAPDPATINIAVDALAFPPTVTDFSKTIGHDATLTFDSDDFSESFTEFGSERNWTRSRSPPCPRTDK